LNGKHGDIAAADRIEHTRNYRMLNAQVPIWQKRWNQISMEMGRKYNGWASIEYTLDSGPIEGFQYTRESVAQRGANNIRAFYIGPILDCAVPGQYIKIAIDDENPDRNRIENSF